MLWWYIRKEEVLETLKKENIFVESAFLDKINNDDYLNLLYQVFEYFTCSWCFQKFSIGDRWFYKENWNQFCEEVEVLYPLLDLDLLTINWKKSRIEKIALVNSMSLSGHSCSITLWYLLVKAKRVLIRAHLLFF